VDDGAADLVPDKEQYRQCHADSGRRDQVNRQRNDHHAGYDREVEPPRAIPQQAEHCLVEHAPSDDNEQSGKRADRHPGDQPAEQKKCKYDESAFNYSRAVRLSAAGDVDERRSHGASAGHAADDAGSEVPQALADEFRS
jgi:hypothetical protein